MAHELWIEAAAKPDPKPRPIVGDRYTEHHTHLPRGRAGAEAAERRKAAVRVARQGWQRHPCELDPDAGVTECGHPDHDEHFDDARELLVMLGLAEPAAEPPPEPDTRRPPPGHKRCSRCRCVKPLDQFHADRHRSDGLTGRCKTCNANRNAARDRRRADTKETA